MGNPFIPPKAPAAQPLRRRTYRARRKNEGDWLAGDADGMPAFQQIFVAEFIRNGEHAEKAINVAREKTGQAPLKKARFSARRMLADPDVQRLITYRRREAARKAQFTVDEYFLSVRDLLDQSCGRIPVRESQVRLADGPGGVLSAQVVDVPVYRPSASGQKDALGLFARALGLYSEIHQLTGPAGGPIQVQSLSADILAARARARLAGSAPEGAPEGAPDGQ
jgi:hypothetical protein